MNNVQKIIKEICDENRIKFNLVSKDWIMILEKDNKIAYISGYKFDLNSQASSIICDDKYALYDVMKQYEIPVAEHYIVFKNYDKKVLIDYCKRYDFNIVVKSNTGTCGNDMYHVQNKNDLFCKIDYLLNKNHSVSLSPYYNIINEYRAIILNNEVEIVYGKKKPIIIGNGKNTIYELLQNFNSYYFNKINNHDSLNKILKENETYEYNWQFNLSKGSIPYLLKDEDLKSNIENMALDIFKILKLRFASVDLIELEDGTLMLLEINSGVMMENFINLIDKGNEIAKNIYKKAIETMFK